MSDTPPRPSVTIYDVAAKAGVSISTVSLALNAPDRVKPSTRERVHASIDQLGFQPKTDAVARARRGIGRIGVVAPFSSHPSFARRLNGVFSAARGRSMEIVVYDEASAADSMLYSLPVTQRVDGMIVMGLPFSDDIAERLAGQRMETVLVELQRPGFSSVAADDERGGRMVAEHLLACGHERLAFIGQRQRVTYASPSERRLRGFTAAIEAHHGSLPEERIRRVEHSPAAAYVATQELLDARDPPTAIFAHDDALAGGVVRGARDRGVRVPVDLAVVGFDDGELAEALSLTTVRQPFEESGTIATQTLMAQLADPSLPARHISLELRLVRRETS
jgi:DNA-binding LacI/PurR family transcriptional regulator